MSKMTSIKLIYDTVTDLLDKNNGKFITADEFNRYVKLASLELFDECIGATNKNIDGRTLVAYGRNQNTDKRLEPFRRGVSLPVVGGEVTLPEDCAKILAVVTSKSRPKALIRIDDDRLGMLFDNPLREPNEDDIYYLEERGTLQIFGIIDRVYLQYLKTPTAPEYKEVNTVITAGSRTVTRKVYDPVNSVDLEWNEREAMDIVRRVLVKIGIPIKDSFLEQMMTATKNDN